MVRKILVFGLAAMITACSISPKPFTVSERYTLATQKITELFSEKKQGIIHLDYYEALARSVKCNLDYRLKRVNTALQVGQLDVALFTMFPALNTTGSLYTRNNDYSVSGITSEGVTTGLSSSTPRTLKTARAAISWNILDFGMGYVKAKQQSDRVLIAIEESRRQLQQLSQDVLVAYWLAYSAQELLKDTQEFRNLLSRSKKTLNRAIQDKMVPKENILLYQAALLDGERKLIQLQYKYDKAMLDLKHLLYLPLDEPLVLEKPPQALFHLEDLTHLNIGKMDAVTLVKHPQLQGQDYQKRLTQFGLQTVILQALPGITLNYGWNYDSNKFLLNNKWMDRSVDVAWNLLNLASLPTAFKTAKTQVQYEKLKSMALTMAALTETRYAYKHYVTLADELKIAQAQAKNAAALYQLNQDRRIVSLASDQQVLLAKLKALTFKLDEDLLFSDLSVALGQLYLSVGVDLVPDEIISKPLPVAISILKKQLTEYDNFSDYIDQTYYHLFKNLPVLKSSSYTVQIYSTRDYQKMRRFYKNVQNKIGLEVSKIRYQETEWYVLTYGRFSSLESANSQIALIKKEFPSFTPWIRKTDHLKRLNAY